MAGLLRDIGHYVLYQTIPQRAQSALIEAAYLESSLAEVERSNFGCDFAEVGAELVQYWGMPAQIEQAIRHQVNPMEAGDFILHASIVHLTGVVVDYEECEPNRRQEVVPFDTAALKSTQFLPDHLPALLKESYEQLQDTLAVINPHAMAA
jgi:HD-like signal output (HDOD) protein